MVAVVVAAMGEGVVQKMVLVDLSQMKDVAVEVVGRTAVVVQ